jgi:PadR family transcriptional regulator PadR
MAPIDTKVVVLQALDRGDGYGLELIDRVRDLTEGRIVLFQGRVYPILRALEADGLATSYEGDPLPERGGRPRRYYRLTDAGKREANSQATALRRLLAPAIAESN